MMKTCFGPLINKVIVRNGINTMLRARVCQQWLSSDTSSEAVGSTVAASTSPVQPSPPIPQTTWDKIVIGEIMEINKHPNADQLNVCQVRLGDHDNLLQIICGASNVVKGARVPVAMVGSKLALKEPTSGELKLLKIKKSKIRGEVSHGMICSEAELGLTDHSDGILILEEDALVGSLVHKWYSIAQRLNPLKTE